MTPAQTLRAEADDSRRRASTARARPPGSDRWHMAPDDWGAYLDARARLYDRCADAAERVGAR